MSFAQGLANGVNMGIHLVQAKDAEDRDKRLQDRQDKQWAREDEQRAALDAANKAARDALQAHRDQYSASVPQPEQRLTFTGNQPQQPGLQLPPMAANAGNPGYGLRADGTQKGTGFLGELKRPDGKVSTEISVGVNLDGKEMDIPTLVPTLTKPEVDSLLSGQRPSDAIVQKAVDHARMRMSQGKSVFADAEPAAASVPAMPALSLNGQGAQGPGADMTLGLQSLPKTNDTVTMQRPAPKYDEREGVLAGLTARRKSLMNSGVDDKLWMDDWAKESQLRGQMRAERVDSAEKRFLATGDPGEYAKAVYPLIDDGFDFVGTKPVKTADGRTAWEFTRRDQQTGREVSNVMDGDQFQRFMLNVRDPKAVAEYEAKALLERIKTNEKIRAEQAAEIAKQGTEGVKHGYKLKQIEADGAQDRKTVGARGAEERTTNAVKPITLGEGQILTAPGKDGKQVTLAEGKPRTLGSTAAPSAPNQVLALRREASQALAAGKDPEKVRARFRDLTGQEY